MGTERVGKKHCVKMDRTLGKLLIATKGSVIFFNLLNQGVHVDGLNCL